MEPFCVTIRGRKAQREREATRMQSFLAQAGLPAETKYERGKVSLTFTPRGIGEQWDVLEKYLAGKSSIRKFLVRTTRMNNVTYLL